MKLLYRNFRLLILVIILIFVWGVSSFQTLPRLEDPELVSRSALVKTFFPGANAERVEALITEKIEDKITEIEEIKTYESTSSTGVSIISIELLDTVEKDKVDGVWSRVRDKLTDVEVELPQGSTEPELDEVDVKAYALLVSLTWKQDDTPNYAILTRKAKSLEDTLLALSGTEKVDIFGAPDEEITVEVNPAQLAALGITATELSQQIQQSDSKNSAGQLRTSKNDFTIEVKGELDSIEKLQQIPIRCNSCSRVNQAQYRRLGDIATIKKGIIQPPSDLALVNGSPGVTVAVFVESNYRLDLWSKLAKEKLNQFEQELPSNLKLQILLDQNIYVTRRLNSLIFNLLFGSALLFIVTVFMMGLQSALVVQVSLLLSVLAVLGCMNLMGVPLHQMSVTGLIVALGILIDNAIIVVDEVHNQIRQGLPLQKAVTASVRYLTAPLIAGTLTTVLAFLPIVLLPGGTGEFVGTIGLSVILAVSASLLIGLTITPVLAVKLYGYLKRRRGREDGRTNKQTNKALPFYRRWLQDGFSNSTLTGIYRQILDLTFARPWMGIALSLILPVLGFTLFPTLETQFFPPADRDQIQLELELPPSASLQQTQSVVKQVRSTFLQHPEVSDVHWFIGRSAPSFYYNVITSRENESNFANALVQLKSIATDDLIQKLQSEMDRAFPSTRVLVRQLEQGPPFAAPVEMRIYGSDIEQLQKFGEKARELLVSIPNVTHTRASLNQVLPQLGFRVDEESARLRGLDNTSIAQQLDTTLEGVRGGSILESTEELPVRVRLSNTDRGNLNQIKSLDLVSPEVNGNSSSSNSSSSNSSSLNSTPLSAYGKFELEPKLSQITRYNGQRVNTVQAFIQAGTLPASVLSQFKQQLSQNFQLGAGYSYEFGGEAEESSNATGGLFSTLGVLIVLMIATLVLSLGSFRLASLIGAIAICSVGLSLLSIWFFNFPFGFNPIIGTIGLVGVAVNDSITVLSALRENPDARKGDRKAVREVVLHATRHVLTTTFTTMSGFIPLIVSGGGFWPPLAVAIAGGIGGATILALFLIPSAYLLINRRKKNRPVKSLWRSATLH